MLRISLFLFSLLGGLSLSAQTIIDSLNREATFEHIFFGDEILFTPETPPLIQMAGAPKAFYSYYWEFGDGHYSKEKDPKHTYKEKGEYEVTLWATNHYDNGKTPDTRPQKVTVENNSQAYIDQASMTEDFVLQRNREPMPEQEIVTILSYKNEKEYTTQGKIYLFYNESSFKNNNFQLTSTRTYHGEKEITEALFSATYKINTEETLYASATDQLLLLTKKWQDTTIKTNLPLTLSQSKEVFNNVSVLEFDNLQAGEERNIFFTFRTTPEMIKDTSAIVKIRGIYVPDNTYDNHKVKDMEMEIVNSHDPNRMSSNAWLLNYRLVRFKNFRFKTKFQNNGDGPARTIRLEIDIPEMFDKNTIEIEGMYPECPICPKEEVIYSCIDTTYTDTKAIFTFKNIYLPGSEQKNVKEIDSTKGFVKYKIKLAKDFHKKKTKSQTAIYFDNNDPIITNYAVTRFTPGISIGAKAGYITSPQLNNSKEFMVGATISPYKSYRGYLQAELMLSAGSFDEIKNFKNEISNPGGFLETYNYEQLKEHTNISVYIVPVSYRYNLNNYIALGAGPQIKLDLNSKICTSTTGKFSITIPDENIVIEDETRNTFTYNEITSGFTHFKAGIFADVTAGFARIGPSIGARYVYQFDKNHNQIQLYAIWKI